MFFLVIIIHRLFEHMERMECIVCNEVDTYHDPRNDGDFWSWASRNHYSTLVQNTIGPSSARVRLPMPDICVSFVAACSVRNSLCCSLLGRADLELVRPGNGRLVYAEWALAGETRGSGAGGWVRAYMVSLGADMCRIWCTSLMVHHFIYTGNLAQQA